MGFLGFLITGANPYKGGIRVKGKHACIRPDDPHISIPAVGTRDHLSPLAFSPGPGPEGACV